MSLIKKFIEPFKSLEIKTPNKLFIKEIQKVGGKVYPFGSSLTRLALNNSDIDLCIEHPGALTLHHISKIASNNGMKRIQIIKARVPIIKFYDPFKNVNYDVNINKLLGVRNSKLIRDYLSIDERAFDLALYIKYWTHQKKLNGYQNYLTSYCFTLLVIHFLQFKEILPDLQDIEKFKKMFPKKEIEKIVTQGYDTTYFNDVKLIKKNEKVTENIDQLVTEFFKYWVEYDYRIPICVNGYEVESSIGKYPMIVVDPFEYHHNTAKNLNEEKLDSLIRIFRQSYLLFKTKSI